MQSDLPLRFDDPPIYRQVCDRLLSDPLPPQLQPEVERIRPRSDVDATGEPIR